MLTQTATVDVEDLATDHEEADTKIAYLIQHAANTNHDKEYIYSVCCQIEFRRYRHSHYFVGY